MTRHDGRESGDLRPIQVQRRFTGSAAGSVLISAGRTTILCTASVDESVPPWKMPKDDSPPSGWLTAEYNMLPGSTSPRKRRDRNKVDGRTTEIQRLIGRSLRSVVDFDALGGRTITVDCDVLEADGGTRTLSITGGFIALAEAVGTLDGTGILTDSIAAISVGIQGDDVLLDLDYHEDSRADVDMNVVMTGRGHFVEVQGTAEGAAFDRKKLNELLDVAARGIEGLTGIQREVLADAWPLQ